MRKRRLKVKGRSREEIILLIEEDDRTQRKIGWTSGVKGEKVKGSLTSVLEGKVMVGSGEDEEAEWVDVEHTGGGGAGREAKEETNTKQDLRKPSPVKYTGRLRGKGVRGYWVGRSQV